jgi:uncharacterized protein
MSQLEDVSAPTPLAPVRAAERISSVDTLRGFALLGILLMNIVGFAFHIAAYGDPTVQGGASGPNLWIYVINSILVDGKMRGIFSLVFGAGIIILTSRAERRGALDGADIYFRRTLWLLVFGLIHSYLIWWGDILYPYAVCALVLYALRRLSPKGMLATAAAMIVLLTGFTAWQAKRTQSERDAAAAADQAAAQGKKLTQEQTEAQKKWKDKLKEIKPGPDEIKKEVDDYRGDYLRALKRRSQTTLHWHSFPLYFPGMWDIFSMMLIGMALMKLSVLSAGKPYSFYGRMALAGYAIGIPLHVYTAWSNVAHNFEVIAMGYNWIPYQPARVAVCLGHVATLMLIVKAGLLRRLTARLAAVGQMAFSNYIFDSVVCSLIFYGYGLALFGKLQRYQLYFVVLGIWTFQLIVSPIWLSHFRFGPLEWLWRSLTYWRKQPMRLRQAEAVPVQAAAQGVSLDR